jgi:uncharacterized protein (TIGR00661 family)
MAKIFYSMAGEGRGHAARVWTLVEQLRKSHDITLFAPHDAFRLLQPRYENGNGNGNVRVHEIQGLRFFYNDRQCLDMRQTLHGFFDYLKDAKPLIRHLADRIKRERPDLVITDFEPALPRAAQACGVPFISLDHQHFLTVSDLSSLPKKLRLHAMYMGMVVRAFYSGQASTIVSSFYFPPLKPRCDGVKQIGVLLRDDIANATPSRNGFLLVYLRKNLNARLLDAIRASGHAARIYGSTARTEGKMVFCPHEHTSFQRDLIECDALITTAGNQLVGEALYLGKPVLALPELGNYEQYMNAHFLRESGGGEWVDFAEVERSHIDNFVAQLDRYRSAIQPARLNGNGPALEEIHRFLPVLEERCEN